MRVNEAGEPGGRRSGHAHTGLPGLAAFNAALIDALAVTPGRFAVVVIDVSNVLTANLKHGRAGGNTVIEKQAERMAGLPGETPLWHLGGDKFAALITAASADAAQHTAAAFGHEIETTLNAPVDHQGDLLPTAAGATVLVPAAGVTFESVTRDMQLALGRGWRNLHRAAVEALSSARTVQELADAVATLGTERLSLACVHATIGQHESWSGDRPARIPDGLLPTTRDDVRVEWWVAEGGDRDVSYIGEPIAAAVDARADLLLSIASERASADYDSLTGLLNRRGFLRRIEELDRPFTIVLADLDRLKQFNDLHGHAAGDVALQQVAELLGSERADDIVARWGGEEFVVALVDTDAEGAAAWLRRLNSAATPGGQSPPVTFSAGVAPCTDVGGLEAAIASADEAMYRAKHAGRATVIVAEGSSGDS